MDRLLAAMGRLDDVRRFAPTDHLPGAGVLLAALVVSGVLVAVRQVYGNLGPAFYGLLTTLVAFVLAALFRIARPEMLKDTVPATWGASSGWIASSRSRPCVASRRRSRRTPAVRISGAEMARRRIAERGRLVVLLDVDGHGRPDHGQGGSRDPT